jgi:hypothetical protein
MYRPVKTAIRETNVDKLGSKREGGGGSSINA